MIEKKSAVRCCYLQRLRTSIGDPVMQVHVHVILRYSCDVPDPRGGVRLVIPEKANYLMDSETTASKLNPEYSPIEIDEHIASDLRVLGEFLEVLDAAL